MDHFLIIFGVMFLIAGIAGCILPVLPGPPFSYAALILMHISARYHFSLKLLLIWGFITVAVTVLDYIIPVIGARKFGAGRAGIWGSIAGLIAGIFFFPPIGIIVGPFAGAMAGELLAGKKPNHAFKAGFGSFAGFFTGIVLKLAASGMMTWIFIRELFA
jgi:uncharacterized protein